MKRTQLLLLTIVASSCSSPTGPTMQELCVEKLLTQELGGDPQWSSEALHQRCERWIAGKLPASSSSSRSPVGVRGRALTVVNSTDEYVVEIRIGSQRFSGNPVLILPGSRWVTFLGDAPRTIMVIWSNGQTTVYSVGDDWEVDL